MSMRTIARSSSNRNSASDLASSVLPVPVGPRNRNEPVGRFGSEMPARERRTASLTARTASRCPISRCPITVLHLEQLGGLALQELAGRDAGPGLDDLGDLLGADLLADQRLDVAASRPPRPRRASSPARGSTRSGSSTAPSRLPSRSSLSASIRSWSSARRISPSPSSDGLLALPAAPRARAAAPRGRPGRRAASPAARPTRRRSPCSSANSSILSRSTVRRSWSISSGDDSISIRSRDAASSMRSIALSGSCRPVM